MEEGGRERMCECERGVGQGVFECVKGRERETKESR
jgi:hypothetical protein